MVSVGVPKGVLHGVGELRRKIPHDGFIIERGVDDVDFLRGHFRLMGFTVIGDLLKLHAVVFALSLRIDVQKRIDQDGRRIKDDHRGQQAGHRLFEIAPALVDGNRDDRQQRDVKRRLAGKGDQKRAQKQVQEGPLPGAVLAQRFQVPNIE